MKYEMQKPQPPTISLAATNKFLMLTNLKSEDSLDFIIFVFNQDVQVQQYWNDVSFLSSIWLTPELNM